MAKPVDELLYDSEAALRQVDSALFSMTGESPPPVAEGTNARTANPAAGSDLGSLVAHGHEELLRVLQDLSTGRARVPVGGDANQQLQHATQVLAQVETRLTSVLQSLSPAAAGTPSNNARLKANDKQHPETVDGTVVPRAVAG